MEIKRSSNKNFGIVFFVVFIIIGFWPLLDINTYRLWAIIIAVIFLTLGFMNSRLLTPLNILWFKFGIAIGSIMAPIVMGIVFFFIVTPTGLIMKMFGKKLLDSKFDKSKNSYWINRKKEAHSMKKQF